MIQVHAAPWVPEGLGARMARAFPQPALHWPATDPFLLLDDFHVPPDASFPEHSHRGFEIITYIVQGGFAHRDSTGMAVEVRAGGVMRLTCGQGLRHAEYPVGTDLPRGLQLWVNLPRRLKPLPPEAEARPAEAVPEDSFPGGRRRRIAGAGGAVRIHTPLTYDALHLEAGASWKTTLPADWTGLVYLLDGQIRLNGQTLRPFHLALVHDEARLPLQAERPSHLAWIAGPRQHEPVRLRGPFVD